MIPIQYKQLDKIARFYYRTVKDEVEHYPPIQKHFQILYKLKLIHATTPLDINQMAIDTKSPKRKEKLERDIEMMLICLNESTGELWYKDDENAEPERQKSEYDLRYIKTEQKQTKPASDRPVGRPKIQDLDTFKARYQPEARIYTVNETENQITSNLWTLARNPRVNPKMDKLYLSPGVDTNTENVLGYIRTAKPWTDKTERYKYGETK
jgi:hypothetical protein